MAIKQKMIGCTEIRYVKHIKKEKEKWKYGNGYEREWEAEMDKKTQKSKKQIQCNRKADRAMVKGLRKEYAKKYYQNRKKQLRLSLKFYKGLFNQWR